MWFGHWSMWIFWIVILLALVWIIARLSGKGKGD